MEKKGGRVSITLHGIVYSARASVTISPATVERENAVNRDGTGYSTIKPKTAFAEISFDRGERSGIVFNDAMLLGDINASIFEEDAGVTHFFTSAALGGTPSLDTETGEITGLRIDAARGGYSFRTE